jgi:hypothetical protein
MIRSRDEDAPRPAGQQCTFAFAKPCVHRRTTLRWRLAQNQAMHLGRYCLTCGRWLGWVPQNESILAGAPPRPRR